MHQAIIFSLIVLSPIVIIVIMLQSKGAGLSIVPGSGDFGKFERRGAELTIHRFTIGIIVLFVILSMIAYLIG